MPITILYQRSLKEYFCKKPNVLLIIPSFLAQLFLLLFTRLIVKSWFITVPRLNFSGRFLMPPCLLEGINAVFKVHGFYLAACGKQVKMYFFTSTKS